MPKKANKVKSSEALREGGKKIKTNESDQVVLLKAQLQRALADYDNLQKRVEKDYLEIGDRVKSQFLINLLPAIQMLYGVQNHLNDPGLALSIQQFEMALNEQGIEKIEPEVGDEFDSETCDAVDAEEDEQRAGSIAEVVATGWKFSEGKVINHAKVKVFK